MLERHLVESQDYRDAMARYAGRVQIVTTQLGNLRRGVTVTAACSVSDNPGTVLTCLNQSNPANRIFVESGHIAINTLLASQQALADAFAGFGQLDVDTRFGLAEWDHIASGVPTLKGAAAVFDCRLTHHVSVSTHMVLFGTPEAI